MSNVNYALQIYGDPTGATCLGFGINDSGGIVGAVDNIGVPASSLPSPAIWMPGQPDMPITSFPDDSGYFTHVDRFGNALGLLSPAPAGPEYWIIANGTSLVVDFRSLGSAAVDDINNRWTVVGTYGSASNKPSQAFIYSFFPVPGVRTSLSPLPNNTAIQPSAINDWGDVVGVCDYGVGFFYSASTQKMIRIDGCSSLNDINERRIAVGSDLSGQPIMVDLSNPNQVPVPKRIPLPNGFAGAGGTATAINFNNTIVGGLNNSPSAVPDIAFVSYNGLTAIDLGTQLQIPTWYALNDAWDINEAGWIVGIAFLLSGPQHQPVGPYAYVAIPSPVPSPPQGPIRNWPYPIWLGPPWGWRPGGVINGPSPLPQVIAAALGQGAPRMPIKGKGSSRLEKILAARRARLFRSSAKRSGRPSRRHRSPRRRGRKA